MYSFLFSFVDFNVVRRHLGTLLEADDVNFLVAAHAQSGTRDVISDLFPTTHIRYGFGGTHGFKWPYRGARHVVGDVSATDDQDTLAKWHGLAFVESAEKIHAVVNHRMFCTGQRELTSLRKANAEENSSVTVAAKIADGEIAAQPHIALEFDTERKHRIDLALHEFARKSKNGNTNGEHAARFRVGFKDGDLVTDLNEIVGDGEAGDTATDDSNTLIVATIGRKHALVARGAMNAGIAVFRAETICDETLQSTNRHRIIQRAAAAIGFARGTTNTAANGGERIGRSRHAVSVFVAAFGDGRNIATSVRMHRTGVLTLDHLDPIVGAFNGFEQWPEVAHRASVFVSFLESKNNGDDQVDQNQRGDEIHER